MEPGIPPSGSDAAALTEWLSSFDLMGDVYWHADDLLIVSYQSVQPNTSFERDWHLVTMERQGQLRSELRHVPRLLFNLPGTDSVYFVSPGAEVPNQWAIATVRR